MGWDTLGTGVATVHIASIYGQLLHFRASKGNETNQLNSEESSEECVDNVIRENGDRVKEDDDEEEEDIDEDKTMEESSASCVERKEDDVITVQWLVRPHTNIAWYGSIMLLLAVLWFNTSVGAVNENLSSAVNEYRLDLFLTIWEYIC